MMMEQAAIFVLEDERAIADMIEIILRKEGFEQIMICRNIAEAKEKIQHQKYDFYLLDIMLPDGSGFDIAQALRTNHVEAPIFFLTAKASDADKLHGFMHGADDYITKPFNPLELVARIKVQLGRYLKQRPVKSTGYYEFKGFTFDADAAELIIAGQRELISGRLFHLLKYLCDNEGQVLSKEQIYNQVWGDLLYDDNTIMVHMRKLREKIEVNPSKPQHIITVRGIGYKLIGAVQ